ncbi:hypothetical protein [Microbacterium sp. Leaf179]|uniref:hypothetical protein n=1 Tax=Microbacterium sp. Leaf179 TaxID=1736288 RepID=UPI0007016148|nr:hypothetical protein [Microbacterium sp. Leaf179]KQR84966.1 hypothetical protein ASF96_13405 [Microbacterium sp. Leaf179]
MGFLDRLFGSGDTPERGPAVPPAPRQAASGLRDGDGRYAPPPPQSPTGAMSSPVAGPDAGSDEDRQAVERYRYLLRTAPPETVEQVHAEAFGRLTPAQRQQVLQEMSAGRPAGVGATDRR